MLVRPKSRKLHGAGRDLLGTALQLRRGDDIMREDVVTQQKIERDLDRLHDLQAHGLNDLLQALGAPADDRGLTIRLEGDELTVTWGPPREPAPESLRREVVARLRG